MVSGIINIIAKLFLGVVKYLRWTNNEFQGMEWFNEVIHSFEDIPEVEL
jgi:hypothetical protein